MTDPMPIHKIWVEQVQVRTFECDFQKRWKPANLMQTTNEIAGQHAAHLGFGFDDLYQRNMAWVLARVRFHYHELPQVGECITVRTWPKGLQQKLFFMRDFLIESASGQRLISASTAWLLVNPHTRRIVMPGTLQGDMPDNAGLNAIVEPLEKITLPTEPTKMEEKNRVEARYSAIDQLGHTNSARYMEWITDCFAPDDYARRKLDWLQINYTSEVRAGEKISISIAPASEDPLKILIQGLNLNTNVRAFEAALRWKS